MPVPSASSPLPAFACAVLTLFSLTAAAAAQGQTGAQQKRGAGQPAGQPATRTAPGGGQATRIGSFEDWEAYATAAGRSRVCFALSQPKNRLPKNLVRDPGYLFVVFRPAENVRNEVALVLGFATKEGGPAEAALDRTNYALLTQGSSAWVKNPAEEGKIVETMGRAQRLTVKVTSGRGNQTTDEYSLKGFGKALEKARTECR